ncbi:MAG: adenylate kinase [Blastocatellia bacterium]|nr:adenylate kinase [Blastocatellia bacterium]
MNVHPRLNLMLIGPPGCGKGTQSVNLSRRYNLLHFSTGNALREQIKLGTPLGLRVEEFLSKGLLVPDDVMIDLVRNTVEGLPPGQGLLLDGFPRTIPQATALEDILPLSGVIAMEIEDEVLVERITGRRIAEDGATYHIKFAPPPDGVMVTQRPDDTEAVVRERLRVYHNQTAPLVDFYRERKLLHTVSADGAIEEVENSITAAVDQLVATA